MPQDTRSVSIPAKTIIAVLVLLLLVAVCGVALHFLSQDPDKSSLLTEETEGEDQYSAPVQSEGPATRVVSRSLTSWFLGLELALKILLLLAVVFPVCLVKSAVSGVAAFLLYKDLASSAKIESLAIDLGKESMEVTPKVIISSPFARFVYAEVQSASLKVYADVGALQDPPKAEQCIATIAIPPTSIGGSSTELELGAPKTITVDMSKTFSLTEFYTKAKETTQWFTDFRKLKFDYRIDAEARLFTTALGIPVWWTHRVKYPSSPNGAVPSPAPETVPEAPEDAVPSPKAASYYGFTKLNPDPPADEKAHYGYDLSQSVEGYLSLEPLGKIPLVIRSPQLAISVKFGDQDVAAVFVNFPPKPSTDSDRQPFVLGVGTYEKCTASIIDLAKKLGKGKHSEVNVKISGPSEAESGIKRLLSTLQVEENLDDFLKKRTDCSELPLAQPEATPAESVVAGALGRLLPAAVESSLTEASQVQPDVASEMLSVRMKSLEERKLGLSMGFNVKLNTKVAQQYFSLLPVLGDASIGTFCANIHNVSEEQAKGFEQVQPDEGSQKAIELKSQVLASFDLSLNVKDNTLSADVDFAIEDLNFASQIVHLYQKVASGSDIASLPYTVPSVHQLWVKGASDNVFLSKLFNYLIPVIHFSGANAGRITLDRTKPAQGDLTASSIQRSASLSRREEGLGASAMVKTHKFIETIEHSLTAKVVNEAEEFGVSLSMDFFDKELFTGPKVKLGWDKLKFAMGVRGMAGGDSPVVTVNLDPGNCALTYASGHGSLAALHSGNLRAFCTVSGDKAVASSLVSAARTYLSSDDFLPMCLFVDQSCIPFSVPSKSMSSDPSSSLPAATADSTLASSITQSTLSADNSLASSVVTDLRKKIFTMVPRGASELVPAVFFDSAASKDKKLFSTSHPTSINMTLELPNIKAGFILGLDDDDTRHDMCNLELIPTTLTANYLDGKLYDAKTVISVEKYKDVPQLFQMPSLAALYTLVSLTIEPKVLATVMLDPARVKWIGVTGAKDGSTTPNLLTTLLDELPDFWTYSIAAKKSDALDAPVPAPPPALQYVDSASNSTLKLSLNRSKDKVSLSTALQLPAVDSPKSQQSGYSIRFPESSLSLVALEPTKHEYVKLRWSALQWPYNGDQLKMELQVEPRSGEQAISPSLSQLIQKLGETKALKWQLRYGGDFEYPVTKDAAIKILTHLNDALEKYRLFNINPAKKADKPAGPGQPASPSRSVRVASLSSIDGQKCNLPCPFSGLCAVQNPTDDYLAPTARVALQVPEESLASLSGYFLKAIGAVGLKTTRELDLVVESSEVLSPILKVNNTFDILSASVGAIKWKRSIDLPSAQVKSEGPNKYLDLQFDLFLNPGSPGFRDLCAPYKLWPLPMQFPEAMKLPLNGTTIVSQVLAPISVSVHGSNMFVSVIGMLLGDVHLGNLLPPAPAEPAGLPSPKAKSTASKLSIVKDNASESEVTFQYCGLAHVELPPDMKWETLRAEIQYGESSVMTISAAEQSVSDSWRSWFGIGPPKQELCLLVKLQNGKQLGEMVGKFLAGQEFPAKLSLLLGDSAPISTPLAFSSAPPYLAQYLLGLNDSFVFVPVGSDPQVDADAIFPAGKSVPGDPPLYIDSGSLFTNLMVVKDPKTLQLNFGIRQHSVPEYLAFAINLNYGILKMDPSPAANYNPGLPCDEATLRLRHLDAKDLADQDCTSHPVSWLFQPRPAAKEQIEQKSWWTWGGEKVMSGVKTVAQATTRYGGVVEYLERCQKWDGAERPWTYFEIDKVLEIVYLMNAEGETVVTAKKGSVLSVSLGPSNTKAPFVLPIDLEGVQLPLYYSYFADPCKARHCCNYVDSLKQRPVSQEVAAIEKVAIDPLANWQYDLVLDHPAQNPLSINFGGKVALKIKQDPKTNSNSLTLLYNDKPFKIGDKEVTRTTGSFPPMAEHVAFKLVYKAVEKRLFIESWDSDKKPPSVLRTVFPMDFNKALEGQRFHISTDPSASKSNSTLTLASPDLAKSRVFFDLQAPPTAGTADVALIIELRDWCDSKIAPASHRTMECRLESADKSGTVIPGKVEFSPSAGLYSCRYAASTAGSYHLQLRYASDEWVEVPKPLVHILPHLLDNN